MESELPFSYVPNTLHRTHRVGAVPVLEVSICYPSICMQSEALEEDVQRFNQGCEGIAQAFLTWALSSPSQAAEEAFLSGNSLPDIQRHRYRRRQLSCRLTLDMPSPEETAAWRRRTKACLFYLRIRVTDRQRGLPETLVHAQRTVWAWPQLAPLNQKAPPVPAAKKT